MVCQTGVMRSLAVLVLVAALLSSCSALRSDDEATCWLKHAAISAQNLVLATEWGIQVKATSDYRARTGQFADGVDRPNYRSLPNCEGLYG